MVSSEIEEITEGSDRAYVLRDGRTVSMLEGEALTEDGILAAMAHGGPAAHAGPAGQSGSHHEGAAPA